MAANHALMTADWRRSHESHNAHNLPVLGAGLGGGKGHAKAVRENLSHLPGAPARVTPLPSVAFPRTPCMPMTSTHC